MTSFTFTADEVRSAPPAVRRWLEAAVMAALAPPAAAASVGGGAVGGGSVGEASVEEALPDLSVCSPEEAVRVLELLRGDAAATRVFLELARELPANAGLPHLHAMSIEDMLHYAHVVDGERLYACLAAIGRAFETAHGAAGAPLFALDDAGFLYVHETTHHSIRGVWQELTAPRAQPEPAGPARPAFPYATFTPRRLGPSESVLRVARRPG